MPDTTARDFGPDLVVFDADNHLYETEDALTRFLPKEYSGLFRYVELNGRKKVVVRDRLSDFIPNPTFEVVAAPGAHMAFFSGDNPEGKTLRELTGKPIVTPAAFKEPEARLGLMDEQGIQCTLMFPTLASLIEERLLDDPDLCNPKVRATTGVNNLEGVGIIEAPRGTLIHHYKVNDDGAMTWANLIVATGHNNLAIGRGVTQVAKRFVDGAKIQEGALNRVSALVRAYDPCLSCSTHILGQAAVVLQLEGPDGELLDSVGTV